MTTHLLDLPDLIEWHEGMLLTPQHFQQFAARGEMLTQFMSNQSGAFAWGVLNLKIDETALGGGVFRILNVEAILPDGLLALGGSERGVDLEFNLHDAKQDPIRIYLAVPRDTTLYQRSDYSRYEAIVANDEIALDDVSGADPASIPRIRAKLRLVSQDANLSAMTALPLIEFSKQGTVCKPTGYVAPLLHLKPGSTLTNLVAPVRKAVREKATELAAKLGPNARNCDLAGLQQVQWLVSGLPMFEALLGSDRTHPYSLYLALCSVAGSVAFLSHARVPPIFPPYNHGDLRSSFQEVIQFIRLAMSEGLVDQWIGKEFTPSSNGIGPAATASQRRSGQLFEISPSLAKTFGERVDYSARFFALMLHAPVGVSPDVLVEWGETCLLATEDAIADLEMSRSQGATCERVDSLEDLVPAPGSVLFRVKNEAKWLDPRKKLILKSAKQETRAPQAATLYIKQRSENGKGS